MSSEFSVRVGEFEGPLELLLNLVEERKLHISQVSLAAVADDFLQFLNQFPQPQLAMISDFILVAATLLLIKSHSLLPDSSLTLGEKQEVDNLKNRLELYQQLREWGRNVSKIFGRQYLWPPQKSIAASKISFVPGHNLNQQILNTLIKDLIHALSNNEVLPQINLKPTISLGEAIIRLTKRIKASLRLNFKQATLGQDRTGVIVHFLAILELLKQGQIVVNQQTHFAELHIESAGSSIPDYQ